MVAALERPAHAAQLVTREPLNVEALLMQAVQSGVPVETMERIMAMRRELLEEQARTAFFTALAGFQADCPVIAKTEAVKDRGGQQVRYRFASLDKIVSTIQPHLRRYDLSYSFSAEFDLENKHLVILCAIHHALGHTETSPFRVPIAQDNFMNGAQHFGSASSYAKRYALCNALGLLTGDEDDDANGTQGQAAKPRQAPAEAQREPAQPAPADPDALIRQKRAEGIAAMGLVSREGNRFKVTLPKRPGEEQPATEFANRDADGIVRCTCAEYATADDTRFRCVHILAATHAVLNKQVQETQPAEAPTEAPAQHEDSEGVEKRKLLERVVGLCVELGYDTATQLRARAKAANHPNEQVRDKDIPSLERLVEQKRDELSQKITAELVNMGLDEEQAAGYVGANGGQGKNLDDCSLAELRVVAESLEIQ